MKLILTLLLFIVGLQLPISNIYAASLLDEISNNEAEFLEPDQAFKISLSATDAQTLKADFSVAKGYYLYRQRIQLKSKDASSAQLTNINFPKGEIKQDKNFGEMEVFHHDFTVTGNITHQKPVQQIEVIASYQGCSEKGLCYAPINKTLTVLLPENSTPLPSNQLQAVEQSSSDLASDNEANTLLKGGNLWLIILGFFGLGLLLSLTPCVFPMIPILSGIIVGQGQQPSKMHSFNLSIAYTLGMAASYTLAGIAAGLSGQLISNALQNPWVLGSSALVFVGLALSMFGFYELQLPSNMESGILNFTNRIKGGKFVSVFIMGVLSALIVSPCVAAPLAGALLYIGQTHDVFLGGVALFALSIGMGVPLLIVGASAGALLPKAGQWMEAVRNFFGVLMIGMAIWLVSPVMPAPIPMLLWGALFITSAIYLHALDSLPSSKTKWSMFWKGIGVIILVYGVSLLIGALSGNQNPLQPLHFKNAMASENSQTSLVFKRIKNDNELDQILNNFSGKYVMLDFYADWCTSCKEYENLTFKDPSVVNRLSNVLLIQADVTQNNDEDKALLKRFNLFGPPGIVFFDSNGKELSGHQVTGYQNPEQFLSSLDRTLPAIH